jgi:hypothetical protein
MPTTLIINQIKQRAAKKYPSPLPDAIGSAILSGTGANWRTAEGLNQRSQQSLKPWFELIDGRLEAKLIALRIHD